MCSRKKVKKFGYIFVYRLKSRHLFGLIPFMRVSLLLLLLGLALAPARLRAQCPVLDDLLAIGAEPTALTSPPVVAAHLSADWVLNPPKAGARETFWTVPASDGGAAALLLVRAQRPGQDVVLKTTQAACVRQLRSELKSRKLTTQEVTCPNCEAVRFQSPEFEATIYSQMKGDYPFIVVVHQVLAAAAPTPSLAPTKGSGAKSGAPLVEKLGVVGKPLTDSRTVDSTTRRPK